MSYMHSTLTGSQHACSTDLSVSYQWSEHIHVSTMRAISSPYVRKEGTYLGTPGVEMKWCSAYLVDMYIDSGDWNRTSYIYGRFLAG